MSGHPGSPLLTDIPFTSYTDVRAIYSDDLMEFSLSSSGIDINYTALLYFEQEGWDTWTNIENWQGDLTYFVADLSSWSADLSGLAADATAEEIAAETAAQEAAETAT